MQLKTMKYLTISCITTQYHALHDNNLTGHIASRLQGKGLFLAEFLKLFLFLHFLAFC